MSGDHPHLADPPAAPTVLAKSVSLADLQAWADLSGDHNRLHVDPEYAARMRYGEPIAHGHLVLAWLAEWAAARLGRTWTVAGQVSGMRFLGPVLTDRTYTIRDIEAPDGEVRVGVFGPDGSCSVEATVAGRPAAPRTDGRAREGE
jgi:MaoC like domain